MVIGLLAYAKIWKSIKPKYFIMKKSYILLLVVVIASALTASKAFAQNVSQSETNFIQSNCDLLNLSIENKKCQ